MFCIQYVCGVDVILLLDNVVHYLLLYELQTLMTLCIYFEYVPKATTNGAPSKQWTETLTTLIVVFFNIPVLRWLYVCGCFAGSKTTISQFSSRHWYIFLPDNLHCRTHFTPNFLKGTDASGNYDVNTTRLNDGNCAFLLMCRIGFILKHSLVGWLQIVTLVSSDNTTFPTLIHCTVYIFWQIPSRMQCEFSQQPLSCDWWNHQGNKCSAVSPWCPVAPSQLPWASWWFVLSLAN